MTGRHRETGIKTGRGKFIFPFLVALFAFVMPGAYGCQANEAVTFSQLISQADRYNGKTVTLEAFYFSGFEISALSESVGPADSGPWRIVPRGTLIWVSGGIPQDLIDRLYGQTDTPSGYLERIGLLKVTGQFETGGRYGHLDAYEYQITITEAAILEWSPPPSAAAISPGPLFYLLFP